MEEQRSVPCPQRPRSVCWALDVGLQVDLKVLYLTARI